MANVNGEITPAEEAKISILDRGFLYGDSVYEVFRTYNGIPFYYEEHFDRLEKSARLSMLNISQSREFLKEEIRRTAAACNIAEGEDIYCRYTITRGSGPVDLDPTLDLQSSYIIVVKQVPAWNPKFYSEGMKLAVPSIHRNTPKTLDPNIKGGNYLNNILAVGEAKKLGADDAVILSHDGYVTECSNSNIHFVFDGKIATPDQTAANLKGLTKQAIQIVCKDIGIDFAERDIKIDDVKKASECFVTSATREVMPVQQIRLESGETISFPVGGGPTTQKLAKSFHDFIISTTEKDRANALF